MSKANSTNQTTPERTLYLGADYVNKAKLVAVFLTGLHQKPVNERDAVKFLIDTALVALASGDILIMDHYCKKDA